MTVVAVWQETKICAKHAIGSSILSQLYKVTFQKKGNHANAVSMSNKTKPKLARVMQ